MSTKRLKAVGWWEPRWSFAPKSARALQTLFAPAACVRIVAASAAVTLVIYAFVELLIRPAMPALQFNWVKALATGIGGTTGYLAFMACIMLFIPPRLTVGKKGIMSQHGQAVTFMKHGDIRTVHLVLRRGGRHFIRVETARGPWRIGLSKNVSLLALEEHLGDKLVVHDRRGEPRIGEAPHQRKPLNVPSP